MADSDPESQPTLRNPEEEEYEEPIPYNDKDRREEEEYEDGRRHSYDYARHPLPDGTRPSSMSRHNSAITTLARLRSRSKADPTSKPGTEFQHPLSHTKTGQDVIVDFESKDDPYRSINWPLKKKITTTLLYGMTTAGITFASSVYSAGLTQIEAEFKVGGVVASLGISLILFGFGVG